MLVSITSAARECGCDPATVRKWIKNNYIMVSETMSSNHKMVAAMMEKDFKRFKNYWQEITTIPDGWVTIPDVASDNGVDRKTVRLWAKKNSVKMKPQKLTTGPATSIMKVEDAKRFHEEYHSSDRVSVQELLESYNTDWRVIQRWAKKHKREFVKVKSQVGGRANYCLTKKDAADCEKYLKSIKGKGWLYLVQPIPEYNPNRIKIGWTNNWKRRESEHRHICPNATMVERWRCDKNQETAVREAVTGGGKRLYTTANRKRQATEVYECDNYKVILERLTSHFS